MPFGGPETVIVPPPLVAPPTGLLQSATIIEHALLESPGSLARAVGPDAPNTILASAITMVAAAMFPEDVHIVPFLAKDADPMDVEVREAALKLAAEEIDGLSYDQRDAIRDRLIANAMVASPVGGMEEGGAGNSSDPFDHWLAGVKWLPENVLPPELIDPCTDSGASKIAYGASGGTGVSRAAVRTASPFLVVVHDSCSTFGWQSADYVGRAQRGLAPKETWAVEREFMHGNLMGSPHVTAGDGVYNSGSPNITSPTFELSADDVGKRITSSQTGIPANTFIGTVVDATHATLSSSATANVPVNATVNRTIAVLTIHTTTDGGNRFLADDNCKVYDTNTVDPTPVQALAYANEVIAKANIGQGMIHVTPFFIEIAAASGINLSKDSRGRIVTVNGNIVVPGNGYDGVGPDGTGGTADDGAHDSGHAHEWIYVSDLPVIWRPPAANIFPASMREAMKLTQNEVTFRAERPYIIAWSALLQTAIKTKVV